MIGNPFRAIQVLNRQAKKRGGGLNNSKLKSNIRSKLFHKP